MNYQQAKVLGICKQLMRKRAILFTLVLIALMSWGCVKTPQAPDYQKASSWVFQTPTTNKSVDVFYVYPTIYSEDSPANMDINNADLRGIAEHLIYSQAGVYSESANVFAPYYRQMSFAKLNPKEDMYKNQYFQLGYSDVSRAFEYYLKNLNHGRPFILAGHSQGSMVLIQLMREYFNKTGLQNQLVAAYLIGYSITPEDFATYPWMKPAMQAADTGVIISYNTQSPEATDSPVLLPGAFCINPLNWTTDETPADKLLNLGAVFYDDTTSHIEREIPHYAGARVDKETGALVTTLPEELDIGAFPLGVYHKYDYTLWYCNLKENVKTRCQNYLTKNKEKF
jgi:pimeloyl-ACP methyl ester carboxylesterase